ncbi:MAG TPA: AMP-binding protein [Puia sp.]|nr:AMP-binding protein [Puia sp.]
MFSELIASFDAHSGRNAFCIDDVYYTYGQLAGMVRRIRSKMAKDGGSRTGRVGIVTTNTIETYASIFACWFSGYAYVPLHPKNPEERTRTIMAEARVDLVLHNGAGTEGSGSEAADLPVHLPADDQLLYILFTSGSTGVPKGVPITYKNVRAFLDSYRALGFRCDASDRFLQMFDLTFDVSVASYLVPLLLGACTYTVPAEGIKYMNVYKLIQKYQITFASIVPSIINYLKPYFHEISLPFLKYCVLTAEASNLNVVQEWSRCLPGGQLVNLYGPTEATIWCVGYFFDGAHPKSYNDMLIIGKPFKNADVLIVDEFGNEVARGEKGEMLVAGDQITPGYINNEERNRTAFISKGGNRYYNTGDVCYVDEDGDIFYCGRGDHQVKIQGFRIELSEIEVAARELFSLNTAAVVYKNALGVSQIGLFLERFPGEVESARGELEKKLPYYMIPSTIQVIDHLPYNNSGKIDRVQLVNFYLQRAI